MKIIQRKYLLLICLFTTSVWGQDNWQLMWKESKTFLLQLSSDAKYLLSAGDDNVIRLWDCSVGKLLWSATHKYNSYQEISKIKFSKDETRIVSAGGGYLKYWETSTGKLLWTGTHDESIYDADISFDGKKVLSAGADNKIRVWDAATGTMLWEGIHQNAIYSATFSPNGEKIITHSSDGKLVMWDSNSGIVLWSADHLQYYGHASFNNDGSKVVTCGGTYNEGTIKVWNTTNGTLIWTGKHTDVVSDVIFSNNNENVYSVSVDKTIKAWDAQNGNMLWLQNTNMMLKAVKVSKDGKIVVSAMEGMNGVKLWDSKTGESLQSLSESSPNLALDINYDGSVIATRYFDGSLAIWTNKKFVRLTSPNGREKYISNSVENISWNFNKTEKLKIEYSYDNGITWFLIAENVNATDKNYSWTIPDTISNVCLIRICDMSDSEISDQSNDVFSIYEPIQIKNWALRWISNDSPSFIVQESSDSKIAFGGKNFVIRDLNTGESLLLKKDNHFTAATFTSNLDNVSVAGSERIITYNLATGDSIWSAELWSISKLMYVQNDKYLITKSYSHNITVWDCNTHLMKWWIGDVWSNYSLSTDSSKIVFYSGNDLYVKDIATGNTLKTICHNSEHGYKTGFSPDGKFIYSIEASKISLWKSDSGNLIWQGLHNSSVTSVFFNKSGNKVITGSDDRNVRVWTTDSGNLLWTGAHNNSIKKILLDEESNELVVLNGNEIKVWEFNTGSLLWSVSNGYHEMIINPKQNIIAATNQTGVVFLDLFTGQFISSIDCASLDYLNPIKFNLNGDKLIIYNGAGLVQTWSDEKFVSIFSPNGGEILNGKDTVSIKWKSNYINAVRLEYSSDSGNSWNEISTQIPAANNSFVWKVPNTASDQYFVRIIDESNDSINDKSNEAFHVRYSLPAESWSSLSSYKIESKPIVTQFSQDGMEILVVCKNVLKIIDAKFGTQKWSISPSSDIINARFFKNRTAILSYGKDNSIKILDSENGNLIKEFQHPSVLRAVDLLSDDSKIISVGGKKAVLWDTQTGNKIWEKENIIQYVDDYISVKFSNTGKYIAIGYSSGNFMLNAQSGEKIWLNDNFSMTGMSSYSAWNITGFYFSIDDKILTSFGLYKSPGISNNLLDFRNTEDGILVRRKYPHQNVLFQFTENNKYIYRPLNDTEALKLFDLENDQIIWKAEHQDKETSAIFCKDGKRLLTGNNKSVSMIDLNTGNIIWNSPTQGIPTSIDISPDQSKILAGCSDSTIYVWNYEGIIDNISTENNLPTNFVLYQNYPNPFNPFTKIKYDVAQNDHVSLKIFNILGQEVSTLVNEEKLAGRYEVQFNSFGLSSGIYFYQLRAGNISIVKKMLLLK